MFGHYHFISTLCGCLQSIKTGQSDFQVMPFFSPERFLRILEGWKRNRGVSIPPDILDFPLPASSLAAAAAAAAAQLRGPQPGSPQRRCLSPLTSAGLAAPAAAAGGSWRARVFPVVEHCRRQRPDFIQCPCNRRSGSVFLRYLFPVFRVIKIQKKSIVSLKGATD